MAIGQYPTRFALAAALVCGVTVFSGSAYAADVTDNPEQDAVPADPVEMLQKVHNRWYIAGRIGGAFADDTRFATLGTLVKSAYEPALTYTAAAGYAFDSEGPVGLRTEAEIGRTSFATTDQTVVGTGTFSGNQSFGNTSSTYGLINAYADYDLGTISPFVSAGIGLAHVDFDTHGTTGTGTLLNDSSNGVAWQVGAGASYAISDSLKLDLGYRYFGINDVGITAADGTSSSPTLRSHEVLLGIRKAF